MQSLPNDDAFSDFENACIPYANKPLLHQFADKTWNDQTDKIRIHFITWRLLNISLAYAAKAYYCIYFNWNISIISDPLQMSKIMMYFSDDILYLLLWLLNIES